MIDFNHWRPIGISDLEPTAWNALRSEQNSIITAGPGAGKTEFLTQKALYLLQTGLCSYPQRILALSFKKDAARNLRDRVLLRINKNQSSRCDSMTYDAFAKNILDRFINSIPSEWRPSPDYRIVSLSKVQLSNIGESADFEKRWLSKIKIGNTDAAQSIKLKQLWNELKVTSNESLLTYTMINRLAEYILRLSPELLQALRTTYPYVFMDEFQDTTYSQYDLIETAFYGSSSILTAVGDDKQRIMLWAGAIPNAFEQFRNRFRAQSFTLIFNHRSRPELVNIQHVIAKAIDPYIPVIQSQALVDIGGDFTGLWQFSHQDREAEYLSHWINEDMQANGLTPRDYCFLTRQKPEDIELILKPHFDSKSLLLRNESRKINDVMIQDILSEDIAIVIIDFLKLIIVGKEP
ncbi:TPA: UvrD-helicase domain-containing protein, partial [Yersinia enterocolitica]|nr:UvrD-helicase domain-containing protein [Yersinia enterocolitica]